jgi:hypothetical protein
MMAMRFRRAVGPLLMAAALASAGCRPTAATKPDGPSEPRAEETKEGRSMEPKINRQCDFSQVEETYTSYPCTPVLEAEDENVIRINAPEEVLFTVIDDGPLDERMANFIICGAMMMRGETLHELGIRDALDALLLVAVDVKTHRSYAGPIAQLGMPEPMPEDLKKDLSPMVGYLFGESFNPNLVRSFELPAVETDYDVHVVLGPFKSNVLRVRLRRKK